MPGRTFTSTSQYRYGFNGKETDSETSTQDYGMRIYNPSLGRFLSVDPLFAEYPFNSTYAFAENSPIANIDLDGAEKLNVAISSEPLDGKAGKATITITLDYIVVTKGAGAMTAAMVDAGDFSARYTKGNTTLYLTKLPTKTNQAEEAKFSDKQAAKEGTKTETPVYETEVIYKYNIIFKENVTVEDAAKWMEEDVPGRGIAMLPIQLAPADALAKGGTIFTLNNLSKLATKSFESGSGIDKGAMGTNPNLGINFNAILANPTYFNDNSTSFRIPGVAGLTRGGVIAHEAGHNSAAEFFHGNNYEYNMRGLSSNDDENIFPTKTNTFKIINDYDNRQTIPEK